MTLEKKEFFAKKQPHHKDHKKLTIILSFAILGMFGFCYLLVPIFNFVCRQTGINGKGANYAVFPSSQMRVDASRTISVEFTSTIHGSLGFKFIPLYRHITLHPGERKLVYFYAENNTGTPKTVQAVPSITPADAARFLKKTECFCFTQQSFKKDEKAEMPVYFYIDPDLPKGIQEITLSYTLFDATPFKKKGAIENSKGRITL